MIRTVIRYAAIAAVIGLGACDLAVTNPNQPETKRVLSSPTDIESLLGNYYKRWHSGMWSTTSNVQGMADVQSFEDYSSLSNNCMGQRVGIPRASNDNSIGNGCATEQARVYSYMSEVNRVASSILATLSATGFTLGSSNQDNRGKAFGQFLRGVSLGYMAMFYDSAAVVDQTTDPLDPGKLVGYKAVGQASMDALQKALDFANTPGTGSGGFPLPAGWIPSSTSMTQVEFIKLIRSYRARIRAGLARTPAERAAVDWPSVVADAQNGITADHDNITNTTTGPNNVWLNTFYAYGTWHQMAPFVIGMADNSGSYAAWIGQAITDRGAGNTPFFMTTPDLRFPQGATRAAQQADFALTQCNSASTACKRYFVNRPAGNDVFSGNGFGWSNYDHARFWSWKSFGDGTSQNGKLIFFTLAELNMLQAEGQIYAGNYAAAAALINLTRVKNGLPPITAFDNTTPVPGGPDCVPKVPIGPNYNTIACGNMMEAMKYEKRIEEAYTGFAQWFIDMRGWGDLPAGTGYHWAPPYQELQARGYTAATIYSTGGGTNSGSAAKGTYGW